MTVMQSINSSDGHLCVDIFRRSDGSFGFEEYRRDAEDPSGWFAIGGHAGAVYADEKSAMAAAIHAVQWFDGI